MKLSKGANWLIGQKNLAILGGLKYKYLLGNVRNCASRGDLPLFLNCSDEMFLSKYSTNEQLSCGN